MRSANLVTSLPVTRPGSRATLADAHAMFDTRQTRDAWVLRARAR
jgi:hypothetical protein